MGTRENRLNAILTSTHNLCLLSSNKKNNAYPCKSQFYYIKVGLKGVKIILACLRDALMQVKEKRKSLSSSSNELCILFHR